MVPTWASRPKASPREASIPIIVRYFHKTHTLFIRRSCESHPHAYICLTMVVLGTRHSHLPYALPQRITLAARVSYRVLMSRLVTQKRERVAWQQQQGSGTLTSLVTVKEEPAPRRSRAPFRKQVGDVCRDKAGLHWHHADHENLVFVPTAATLSAPNKL